MLSLTVIELQALVSLDDHQQNVNSNTKVDNNIITPAISIDIFLGRLVNLLPNRNSSQKAIPYSDRQLG